MERGTLLGRTLGEIVKAALSGQWSGEGERALALLEEAFALVGKPLEGPENKMV